MNPDINRSNPLLQGNQPSGNPPIPGQAPTPYLDPTAGPPAPIPAHSLDPFSPQTRAGQPSPFGPPPTGSVGIPGNPASGEFKQRKSFWKRPKLLLLTIFLPLLLIGGGAAAYFVVVVPTKPENKLLAGFANAANQRLVTLKGKVDGQANNGGGQIGYSTDFTMALDGNNNNFALGSTLGVAGTKFPVELRFVDKNFYFKVGGLDGISALAPYFDINDPAVKQYLDSLKKINDQWYEVDRSVLGTTSDSASNCLENLNTQFSAADKELFKKAYRVHQPLIVKNNTPAVVDTQAVTKYELTLSDGKALKDFASKLNGLSIVQKLNECNNSQEKLETGIDESSQPSRPFFIYLDSKKEIKKFEMNYEETQGTVKIETTFNWGSASISKPEGAKPVQDILTDIFGAQAAQF